VKKKTTFEGGAFYKSHQNRFFFNFLPSEHRDRSSF